MERGLLLDVPLFDAVVTIADGECTREVGLAHLHSEEVIAAESRAEGGKGQIGLLDLR